MKPSEALRKHRDEIRNIVLKNNASNPRLFGSVVRGEDDQESDLDILVDPVEGKTTLLSLALMEEEISVLTGVNVDIQTPLSLPLRFRDQVLNEALPL